MIGAFISLADGGIRRRSGTRWPCLRSAIALLFASLAGSVAAVGPNNALNDTGITTFGDATSNSLTGEPVTFRGQDARYGRDGAAAAGKLPKVGAGSKGFDFTRIANDGTVLPASAVLGTGASDWACTYDNVTGLMWEVKVADVTHLRDRNWTYSWYDGNTATNGGSVGTASGGNCKATGRCDTEKFVQDVNAAGLCGHSDWRMPTKTELLSIVDFGRSSPAIDVEWFPNTPALVFWSASAYVYSSAIAWSIHFGNGADGYPYKYNGDLVRLVRDGL